MRQMNYFKLIYQLFDEIFKIFGLLPQNHFKSPQLNLIIFYIYSITFLSITIYYYKDWSFVARSNLPFVSNLTIFYSKSLHVTGIGIITIVYLLQHLNLAERLKFEAEAKIFLADVNQTVWSFNTRNVGRNPVILYTAIVIVTNVVYELPLYIEHSRAVNNAFLTVVYILQSVIPTLLTDYFCGGMLVVEFYFKHLNIQIRQIISRTIYLTNKVQIQNGDRKYNFMQQFCDLSDRLDRMAAMHKRLSCLTLEYNRIWSKLTLFYVIWRFYLLVTQSYVHFIVIKLAIQFWRSNVLAQVIGMILLFSHAYSLVKIAYCCQRVVNEVCQRN